MLDMHVKASTRLQPLVMPRRAEDKACPGRRALGRAHRDASLRPQSGSSKSGPLRDPVGDLQAWLERLYQRCQQEELIDVAIDQAIEAVDNLLFYRKPERCDELLEAVDVYRVDVSVALALLMESLRARHVLRARGGLYLRLEQRLRAEQPEDVEALLDNLR